MIVELLIAQVAAMCMSGILIALGAKLAYKNYKKAKQRKESFLTR